MPQYDPQSLLNLVNYLQQRILELELELTLIRAEESQEELELKLDQLFGLMEEYRGPGLLFLGSVAKH
jgi:hypothetical protein